MHCFGICLIVACNCDTLGSDNLNCTSNGVCSCKRGYTGDKCNLCASGYTGNECNECASGYLKEQTGECTGIITAFF